MKRPAIPRRHPDEDPYDAPRPKKRKHKKRVGPSTALIVGLSLGGLLLLTGGAIAAVLLLRKDKSGEVAKADPFPNMLAHWSFDQPDERVRDLSGHGNDGTLSGGMFVPGKKSNALVLGGRDDQFVDVGARPELNIAYDAEFTLAAWFQTTEKVGTILSFRHSTLPGTLDLFMRDNHALGICGDETEGGNNGRQAFCWCHPVNDGQWHHITLTRSGQFVEVFYDGVSQGKDTHGACRGKITTDLRAIGCERKFVQEDERRFGRAGFKGMIDEVYMFSRALTGEEIQVLMRR